jgi:hypothetical protein
MRQLSLNRTASGGYPIVYRFLTLFCLSVSDIFCLTCDFRLAGELLQSKNLS